MEQPRGPGVTTERVPSCPECGRDLAFCERCGHAQAVVGPSWRARLRSMAAGQPTRSRTASTDTYIRQCAQCLRFVGQECWNPVAGKCLECRPAAMYAGGAAVAAGPRCPRCDVVLPRQRDQQAWRKPVRGPALAAGVIAAAALAMVGLNFATAPGAPSATLAARASSPTAGVAGATATPPRPASPTAPAPSAGTTPTPGTDPGSPPPLQFEVVHAAAHSWVDGFGSRNVHVVVEARNTGNEPVRVRGAAGSYELYDGADQLVHQGSFVYALPSIAEPGAAVYFVDTVRLDFAPLAEVEHVEAAVTVPAAEATPGPALTVAGTSVRRTERLGIAVEGTVVNESDGTVAGIVVGAVLFDADGEPLAMVYTAALGELEPGERAAFTAESPPTPPIDPAEIASTDAFAFVSGD